MATIALLLLIAALVLAIVALVESRARSFAAWGVLCLAVALLLQSAHL